MPSLFQQIFSEQTARAWQTDDLLYETPLAIASVLDDTQQFAVSINQAEVPVAHHRVRPQQQLFDHPRNCIWRERII